MPDLMQDMQVLSSSPVHSIVSITVNLDPNPDEGDVYWQDKRNKLLSLSKPGYMKLLNAAGMEEVSERCVSNCPEDFVFFSKQVFKWMRPDGKEVVLSGDKTLDLRIGGSRWQKAWEKAMDRQLQEWGKKNGVQHKQGERYEDWSSRIKIHMEQGDLGGALEMCDLLAKEKANREIRQKAQFGTELAQTGAIERAVKGILGLKSTYSPAEISEGFTVISTEIRWDMMAGLLGEAEAKKLRTVFVAKQLGITPDDMALLGPGPQLATEEPTAPSEDTIEVEFFDEDEENPEAALFRKPPEDATMSKIRTNMCNYHKWRSFNATEATKKARLFFNKAFGDLNEGEMRLFLKVYQLFRKWRDDEMSKADKIKALTHLREQIAQCLIEKRLWREPETVAEQTTFIEEETKDDVEGNSTGADPETV